MAHTHHYAVTVTWTGNTGQGTAAYRAYRRDYEMTAAGKPVLLGSSDPAFRGDETRWNPEDMLVAALSGCHMLWYLHLCAQHSILVSAYTDQATGTMAEEGAAGGAFTGVTLRPRITLAAGSDQTLARSLHTEAHAKCFIARSVNFPVTCEPVIEMA